MSTSGAASHLRYPLALLPLAVALDEAEVAVLTDFVQAGGVLLVGPLAGHRCPKLQGPFQREPPGLLAALTGTANGETTTLDEPALLRCRQSGASIQATRYAEILQPRVDGTEVLAEHARAWFAGTPAVTRRRLGAGCVVHCGVALCDDVLSWLLRDHLGESVLPTPAVSVSSDAAELLTRSNREIALHFLLNHGPRPVPCQVHRPTTDLLTGATVPSELELPGYGYRLLRERL